ncbi:endo-1,3(4)-beta-glucanase 2 [[Candida] jaroonii]|uniref:Endo-1,3(4)-beta-glucanase 2 n=1 Tax=[Candida] jaroonii TaxID=467808 RepID=A0ACA9YBT0_9ASCO|nr:endo-1,3(4)-beta-glucanase 2 [[Candida] jaroonii]
MGFLDLKKAIKKIDQSLKDNRDSKTQSQPKSYDRPRAEIPAQKKSVQTNFNIDGGIFETPISTDEPPSIFKRSAHHQPPVGCKFGGNEEAIHTNNFYNNLTLEDQTFPVWTQPYSLWLSKDPGQEVGFAFNHTEASQRVFGPEADANPAQFYFNPPRIKSFVLGGENFNENNVRLTLDNHEKLSVTSRMIFNDDPNSNVTIPLTHGMGFITAVYNNIKAEISSQVGVQHFERVGQVGTGGTIKYKVQLFNQVLWSMFVTGNADFSFKDNKIVANTVCNNVIVQFCRGDSKHYDDSSGCFPVSCKLSGRITSQDGKRCQYSFNYDIQGNSKSGSTIVWCLPHHQEVLVDEVKKSDTGLQLDSTTKGIMRAYATNKLVMEEFDLPTEIMWEPWSTVSTYKGSPKYNNEALDLIQKVAEAEVQQDVYGMSNIDSMYTSGKVLDKFAYIAYVCHFILKDDELTAKIFPQITKAIEIFSSNKQKFPLIYDTSWKGLISSAEPGADFGNANYNDHHFHYGYHIHAVALVAQVDKSYNNGEWFKHSNVRDYVTTLIRDVANPSTKDRFFPQSRSFDWFHGHSFAHGIFASGDGKDEESSSEDYHFAYGMKLYAHIIGDKDMEARSNLMLAIMKRSMNMYMLFSDDNTVQPKNFIRNKVAGISFENKLDFATYFGRGTIGNEWIHGIHMLPITPISSYIRLEKFVKEEWNQILEPIVDQIPDGWKGILMLNLALFDPKKSWKWFSREDWNDAQIDNGMSRTWSLAYIAGVGGI